MVFSTASSGMRSRTACAIVLPVSSTQREEHRAHDRSDDQADVGELADEGRGEGLLGLGLGLVIGVGGQRIDRLRDAVGLLAVGELDGVPADLLPLPNWRASSK